jgi:putative transposase
MWIEIPLHFPNSHLDEYIFMPNHIHGIILLDEPEPTTDLESHQNRIPSNNRRGTNHGSISAIIQAYKSSVTRNIWKEYPDIKIWQVNYYDHIIRNYEDYDRIRSYLGSNPEHWVEDQENK